MKDFIPKFNDFMIEMTNVPFKQWTDFVLKSLDKETMEIVWNMYTTTYGGEGLDFSATDMNDLQQKYSAIFFMDVNNDKIPDAFIIYRKTEFGNKIALSGTNGSKEAKSAFVKKLIELICHTKNWYVEGSMKIDEILTKNNAPVVNDEQKVRMLLNKDITWKENGYYSRKLSRADKFIDKRMYGTPKI